LPVLIEKVDGGIQQRLPYRLSVILNAGLDGVGEDVRDYGIGYFWIVVHETLLKGLVDAAASYLHRLLHVAHTLVYVFHAVICLVLFADLQALFDR